MKRNLLSPRREMIRRSRVPSSLFKLSFLFTLLLSAARLSAGTIVVSSVADLQTAINNAVPGDVIVLANGVYTTTSDITVNKKGTADQPITIAAQTIGGAEIRGTGGFNIASPAAYIVIKGFKFTHNASRAKTASGTSFCRFTRNIFETPGEGEYLTIAGSDHQVDYNTFQNKTTLGRFIAIRGSGSQIAQRLWIHHNYFFNFTEQTGNGAETFQFGLSGYSLSSSNSIVEYNLFEKCHGENELLSVKASAVTIRYNTIRDCPAQFTLRHGNRCIVYGNYFVNTPGIRIFGDDHVIFSNHFENCNPAINIGNGDGEVADGAPLTSHDRPDRVLIAYNTTVNPAGYGNITMSGRTNGLGATSITVVNNIVQGGGAAATISGPYPNPVWKGNIIYNTTGGGAMPDTGYTVENPLLAKDVTGTYHLQTGSPAIGAGVGSYPAVTVDMDGQPRTTPLDAGADQVSSAPAVARILSPTDVGPNAAGDVPVAGINAPADRSIVEAGAVVRIEASALSFNAAIEKVQFYIDSTLIGEDTSAPYTINWEATEGNHLIKAVAVDDKKKESSPAIVTITVNPLGSRVTVTSPENGDSLVAPAQVTINTDATDSLGTITKVEFFNGQTKLGVDSTSPYSFKWADVVAGKYTLQARSTDDQGRITVSAPVTIIVTAPVNNASFDITDNGGIITAQYPNTTKPSENFPSLIDNNKSTKYYRSGRTALWVQYQSPVPAIVVRYTITSANDVPNRDPKSWMLQGSNNGSTWTTLDTRSGETFASRFLTKSYSIDNINAYTYYRLSITANNGETGTQFAEWELFERKLQEISFDSIGNKTYGDDEIALSASTNSGLPILFEVVAGPATVEDSTLTITGAGTVTVRASQAGNDDYFPAGAEQSFVVNKAQQDIEFEPIETKTYGDSAFTLKASVESGLPIGYELVSGPATVHGDTVTITGAGDVTVRAVQPGNENYEADTAVQKFTVNKAAQTVSFPAIPPKLKYQTIALSAAASSGLPVNFSLVSGAAILTGDSLKFLDYGLVVVRAVQPGNENYLADSAEQTILVMGPGSFKAGVVVTLFPNPTSGPLRVRLHHKQDREYSFVIISSTGNQVAAAIIPRGQTTDEVNFNLSSQLNGLYFLHVTDGVEETTRVIVKY